MRKFFFYIATAFLAFGIGVGLYYLFTYQRNSTTNSTFINQTNYGSLRKDLENNKSDSVEKIETEKPKTKQKCENKLFSIVIRDLLTDDKTFDKEYFASMNCEKLFVVEKLTDLNNDSKNEYIIRGEGGTLLCSATGNCLWWIYKKIGNNYKKLLEANGKYLEVQKKHYSNYKNIDVKFRDSCCSFYQTTYKFNGKIYRENNCDYVDYGTTGIKSVMSCKEYDKQYQ